MKKEEKVTSQLGKNSPQQLQSFFYTHTQKKKKGLEKKWGDGGMGER